MGTRKDALTFNSQISKPFSMLWCSQALFLGKGPLKFPEKGQTSEECQVIEDTQGESFYYLKY